MLLGRRWTEVFLSPSQERFNSARHALKDAGIAYKYKLHRHDSAPLFSAPARNLLGRAGEDTQYATMHYLYVPKAEAEKAAYLLRSL